MPFVYAVAESLLYQPGPGHSDCAALVRRCTKAGPSSGWIPGERVAGNEHIAAGTAIATFRNGRYTGAGRKGQAALFLRHGADGAIVVVGDGPAGAVGMRSIRRRGGPCADGSWPQAGDNADAFFVIENRLTTAAPAPKPMAAGEPGASVRLAATRSGAGASLAPDDPLTGASPPSGAPHRSPHPMDPSAPQACLSRRSP